MQEPENHFGSVDMFVEWLAKVYARPVTAQNRSFCWCPRWWEHDEAVSRLEAFQRAIETGDLQGLVDIFAPDVVALSAEGASSRHCRGPLWAPTRWLACWLLAWPPGVAVLTADLAQVNGWPALIVRLDGEIDSVVAMRVEDGLVSGIYTVRNPEKLSRILREAAVSR